MLGAGITMQESARYSEGKFSAPDGATLYEQWWQPGGDPRAVVLIVHGIAEHSGRHAHVGEHLAQNGFAVCAYDQRGHGFSDGERSFIERFDDYLDDLEHVLVRAREKLPSKPVFLLGHSTGGLIVATLAVFRNPAVRGMVLSGPLLIIGEDVPPLLVKIAPLVGRLLPRLKVMKLDSASISRDADVAAAYDSDPLVYREGLCARTGAEINGAVIRLQAALEQATLPFLILHGSEDRLSGPDGSRQFHARARSDDKGLKMYAGFYHEVLNEPEKHQVLADLTEWLQARG